MIWPFNKDSSKSKDSKSEIDKLVPPPPSGNIFNIPIKKKRNIKYNNVIKESNFDPLNQLPPKTINNNITTDYNKFENNFDKDYINEEDLYTSNSVPDISGLKDDYYSNFITGVWIQHPRARACFQNILIGIKMGAAVGGCFGLLAGSYTMFAYRNFWYLPISIVGASTSFGFFLSCGMLVRCEELGLNDKKKALGTF